MTRNLDEEIGTVTHEEAQQLALCLIDKCFNNPEKPGRRWQASIPVSPQDTDVRMMAYIRQQKALAESRGAQSRPDSSVGSSGSQDRATWAVRVLDAWAERIGKSCGPCPDGDGRWFIPLLASCFTAESPDACRIKAAEAIVELHPSLNVQPEPSGDTGQTMREVWVAEEPSGVGYPLPVFASESRNAAQANVDCYPSRRRTLTRYVPENTVPSQAAGGWVRVEDRLPEPFTLVQFHVDGWPRSDARFVGRWDGTEWRDDSYTDSDGMPEVYPADRVKLWRELPPAPEKP